MDLIFNSYDFYENPLFFIKHNFDEKLNSFYILLNKAF